MPVATMIKYFSFLGIFTVKTKSFYQRVISAPMLFVSLKGLKLTYKILMIKKKENEINNNNIFKELHISIPEQCKKRFEIKYNLNI